MPPDSFNALRLRSMNTLLSWLKGFTPAPILAGKREKMIGCVGAWVGLLFSEWISRSTLGDLNPWFIAPMGASAVLLFAVPSSPLAQPWSLVGGNIVSAFIGVTCAQWIDSPMLAASAAAALAIGAMFSLRCLHPPSGAVALTAVLGGPAVHEIGYRFVLWPVAVNSLFLLLAALVFNNILRRRYPHPPVDHSNQHRTSDPRPGERLGFTRADVEAALKTHQEIVDISEDDLEELFMQTEMLAFNRRSGNMRCDAIMSKDVVTAHVSLPVMGAWRLLAKHHIHALPVVDDDSRLAGIVTLHDVIVEHDARMPMRHTVPQLKRVKRVEQIMVRDVQTARPDQPIADLVTLFSNEGFHHLPVIDDERRVIGMVTQSDLVAALYRISLEEKPAA